MRRKYIYAITLVLLSLAVWLAYYFYMEYRPKEYKYGTFVELPTEWRGEQRDMNA